MPYFKNLNILFIHIPKTGGSVIADEITKKGKRRVSSGRRHNRLPKPYNKKSLQHQFYTTLYKYRDRLHINFKNIKIFSVVRNPYDRTISDLFYNNLIKEDFSPDKVFDVLKNNYLYKDNYDNHNVPQYKFVTDKNEKLIPNIRIFKTETLNKDNKLINDYLKIDINIVQKNVNKDYSKYLNKKSINLINEFYYKDFELFNYKMI